MDKKFRKINYEQLVRNEIKEDHRICDQLFLMDKYYVNPTEEYPFIPNDNIFIEVFAGKGYLIIDGKRHEVDGHCLIALLKGQSVITRIESKNTLQRGISLTDEFLEDVYQNSWKFCDMRRSIILNPVMALDPEEIHGVEVCVATLKEIASNVNYSNPLVCAKLAILALFYGPLYERLKNKYESENLRAPLIASRFFTLLEKNFKEQHNLSFYADALNISKPYLYECIASSSGKSPSYWVNYFILSQAKKSLGDMDLSIQQIAIELNFAGSPQFGKFFKKQTGITPGEYRKSIL